MPNIDFTETTIGLRSLAVASVSALALLLGSAAAQPVFAGDFSAHEGFGDNGAPKLSFEADPYLFLPNTKATIGLNRPGGEDVNVDRPRPTIAEILPKLSFAFSCDCLARYGNLSFETNILYISLKQQNVLPPIAAAPEATLEVKVKTFYISPGVGYRLVGHAPGSKVSMDARAGFTYASISADADFTAGEFAKSGNVGRNFAQPWIGERLDYYPSPKWRLENTAALSGLGVNNGSIGYNGKVAVSYLVSKWFDITAGYAVNKMNRNAAVLADGTDRSVSILMYGPVVEMGFRF